MIRRSAKSVGWALPTILLALGWLGCLCLAQQNTVAQPAKEAQLTAALRFANGDFLSGHLLDSDNANAFAWHSASFRQPLAFAVLLVQSIEFGRTIDLRLAGPYCFELAGGDTLLGSLVSLDDREAVIQTPGLGPLHLDRTIVHRFYRTSAADAVFAGPGALAAWETAGPAKAWREESGHLRTEQPDATLRRTFQLPPLARYELELSWNATPNFEFSVGVDSARPTLRPAFRLETWGDELVIIRETERTADFASLQKLPAGPGNIHFQVLFDQKQGRLLVVAATGEKLADLIVPEETKPSPSIATKGKPLLFKLPAAATAPAGGVQLVNRRGDLKIERFTISRWSGNVGRSSPERPVVLQIVDGSDRSANSLAFDASQKQFVVHDGDSEQRLDEAQVQDIILSPPGETAPRSVRLVLITGERISGNLLRIERDRLTLQSPGVHEPLMFPLDQLHALFVLQQQIPPLGENTPAGALPEGRLELDGLSLHGRLTGVQSEEPYALLFQPRYAAAASPLESTISGRLVYREPPPPPKPEPTPQSTGGAPALARVRVLNGVRTLLGAKTSPAARPAAPGDCVMHLRSGDTLICRVERIDEENVWIKSSHTTAKYVPHVKIKALELRLDIPPARIDKTKADRLLTLPRMQRDNPPEQLIRSLEGDYLRGRILAMDEKELQIEVRLEKRTIDRAQIARIIWLHPDEIVSAENAAATPREPPPEEGPPPGVRVQSVPRDNRRLTFYAQRVEGQNLIGTSEVLGDCRAPLDQINFLLFGRAIDQSAASLAFHQWKLRPAPEPLPDPGEGGEPSSSEGLESVLVGKPAPPIDLDLLDGKKFRLTDYKNKTLVIDFWASWCGPCLQTMPQVDAVAREFAEHGVTLVAINLEETPERIRTALERLKLDMPVALDRDGRVAERYGATSIPQTVIIDREGKVVRLFVGGNARFDATLRQALKSVLNLSDPKTD